jgi:two-component system, LytTR family, sensor histidine kinase AlgZ
MVHPILADGRRIAIYLSAWVPVEVLLALLLARHGTLGLVAAAVIGAPLAIVYAFICLSAFYVCRSEPLESARPERTLAIHIAAAAVSSGIWLVAARILAAGAARLSPIFAAAPAAVAREQALIVTMGLLLFLLASAVHYVLLAAERSREIERQSLELRILAREAELRALRAQIDPHFLFNSLHSIGALTGSDPPGARRMAILLADFLRDTIALGGRDRISLSDELRMIDRFLAIERVRFGERLAVELRLDERADVCQVPPLILQPLVENAVTHGIAGLVEGGTIRIQTTKNGSRLAVVVENPCDPDRRPGRGTGVGLANVGRRLEAAFGGEAWMTSNEADGRFRVELTLPVTPGTAPTN